MGILTLYCFKLMALPSPNLAFYKVKASIGKLFSAYLVFSQLPQKRNPPFFEYFARV